MEVKFRLLVTNLKWKASYKPFMANLKYSNSEIVVFSILTTLGLLIVLQASTSGTAESSRMKHFTVLISFETCQTMQNILTDLVNDVIMTS